MPSGFFPWHAADHKRFGDQHLTYLPFIVEFAYRLRPTILAIRHLQNFSVDLGVLRLLNRFALGHYHRMFPEVFDGFNLHFSFE